MHIMIVSLSGRKSGFDVMGPRLQSAMAALVYNKPFSFSQFFMDEFVQQIHAGGRERFSLYPRFIMILIQHLLPNLQALPNLVQVSAIDRRLYADCQHHNSIGPLADRPIETPLFGHLVNPNYLPPPNDDFLDDEFHQQQPQPQQDDPAEQQAMLDDVFGQMEGPQAVHGINIDEGTAEVLIHEMLEPVRQESPRDQDLDDIDAYFGETHQEPEVGEGSGVQEKGKEIVVDSSMESEEEEDDDDEKDGESEKDDDDENDSDDDDSPDYSEINKKFERVGHQLLLKGSSSRKRMRTEDIEFFPEEEESDDDQLQRRTKRHHNLSAQSPPSLPQETTQ